MNRGRSVAGTDRVQWAGGRADPSQYLWNQSGRRVSSADEIKQKKCLPTLRFRVYTFCKHRRVSLYFPASYMDRQQHKGMTRMHI